MIRAMVERNERLECVLTSDRSNEWARRRCTTLMHGSSNILICVMLRSLLLLTGLVLLLSTSSVF
jgi:hypothetical protein